MERWRRWPPRPRQREGQDGPGRRRGMPKVKALRHWTYGFVGLPGLHPERLASRDVLYIIHVLAQALSLRL